MTLELAYIGLSVLMTIFLVVIGIYAIKKTFDSKKATGKIIILIMALLGWHIYIYTIASSGALEDLSFPPRFALYLIIPSFIFTGVFLFMNRKNAWVQHIPTSWLVYIQSFRILVETIFVYTVGRGLLPKIVTIEGSNYDMIFAITALIIGYFACTLKRISMKVIIVWNYIGLLVIASIIFLFMTAIYIPEIHGIFTDFPTGFTNYPYVLIPGFLMPVAVFIHVLSIVQLIQKTG